MDRKYLKLASSAMFAAGVLIGLGLGAPTPASASCPNEAIREGQTSAFLPQGSTTLPACMALEMVSPPTKYNNYAIVGSSSPDGHRVRFLSGAALADTPKLGFITDRYIATRTDSGWATQSTAVPPDITIGSFSVGYPCSFSTDLSRWVLWGSTTAQGPVGITTPFSDGLNEPLTPIGPTMTPLTGNNSVALKISSCEGASSDASRLLFNINAIGESSQAVGFSYLPGDPVPIRSGNQEIGNVYEAYLEAGIPSVRLLQRDKDGLTYGGSCGAKVGGDQGGIEWANRGAVSADARRIFFTIRPSQTEGVPCNVANKYRIMERLDTPSGPVISELIASECTRVSPPCSNADGDDEFLGASQEGDKVYFTTTRQLADTDLDTTSDLYLHESTAPPGERLTQVSAGAPDTPTPGEGAEVQGLADFAGDGSHAYFVANGVLSENANQAGHSAVAGQPNLYLYERDVAFPNGRTVYIGTLNQADGETWGGGPGSNEASAVPVLGTDLFDQSVGGDGHIFVFVSKTSLLPLDADGGFRDEYRYNSDTGNLEQVTVAAPGGSANGSFSAGREGAGNATSETGPQALYFNRTVSEDGDTIVFRTEEPLDPTDTNEASNAYIWYRGSTTALPFAAMPNVSASGNQVTFETTAKLLPEDGDGAKDVYAARVDGGFPPRVVIPPCVAEACQGPPAPQPGKVSLPTESTNGVGNAPPCPTGKHRVSRKGKSRCADSKHRKHHKHAVKRHGARR